MDLMSKREILPLAGVARDVKPLEQLTTSITHIKKKVEPRLPDVHFFVLKRNEG